MLRCDPLAVELHALHLEPHALFERGVQMQLDLALHAGDALPGQGAAVCVQKLGDEAVVHGVARRRGDGGVGGGPAFRNQSDDG